MRGENMSEGNRPEGTPHGLRSTPARELPIPAFLEPAR
ncbi:hypothetical protein TMO_1564 [Tistrella mobilis KA081020-065]|uniref:Uncharacterized protein n=1 Tax=Tistrella mobilis (strain KA081020-065) TaxID=1110502 RepID=I3TKW5_TISMK|nr:hypothetical protein TMO_1564 [Tistrella mobilis KA081020-065]